MSVLITAFEPFDGEKNSSEELLRYFQSNLPKPLREGDAHFSCFTCSQSELQCMSLGERIRALLLKHNPRSCILLGQAASRRKLSLERIAVNLCNHQYGESSYKADAICTAAPQAYLSTFPKLESFYESLGELNKIVEVSNHAGIYLCNEVYFEALHYARSQGKAISTIFVHIPLTEDQARRRGGGLPFVELEKSYEVLTKAVLWLEHADRGRS